MSTLLSDLRHAVRSLLKSPGLTLAAILSLIAVPIILGSIALLASWIAARRAGRVDPLVALRYE